jgi:hypothetical protein
VSNLIDGKSNILGLNEDARGGGKDPLCLEQNEKKAASLSCIEGL